MSYRGREIETKLIISALKHPHLTLDMVGNYLSMIVGSQKTRMVYGSSTDTYWSIESDEVRADFLRIRERDDGTTEITVKGKDRDEEGLNRLEIDIHSATKRHKIASLFRAALGKPAGLVRKSYYVYWLDEHTTISCYTIQEPQYPHIIIEVESTEEERVLTLTAQVREYLSERLIGTERAPGSLYEMLILNKES